MNSFSFKRTKMLRGVTLMELLIAIAIISILTSIVFRRLNITNSKTNIDALNRTKIYCKVNTLDLLEACS